MSLATWYSSQYSTWNRTRRLQQPQFVARTDTNTSRVATAMAQNAQPANTPASGDLAHPNPNKDKKASDPLFGPNIGPCSAGPAWTTAASRKKLITDDLTPEVLSGWIEKSKQPSHPTTTLQALVNLKRPTLRLSPLSSVPEDAQGPIEPRLQHLHGLEFEYDCDAPKCGIYVHVVLSKAHPEAIAIPSATNQAQILVFESVTSGGFGKRLTLEEGALLELGRYDHVPIPPEPPISSSDDLGKSESATDVTVIPSAPNDTNTTTRQQRRRFTQFHFRKRSNNRSVAGPALAVVDADPNQAHDVKKDKTQEEQEGIRVLIRLVALDEQGTELASPNEQTTFLHIVRLGAKPTEPTGEDGEVDDNRPWVVKVVKREATIGPHTFQLHEIYGLTSSTSTGPSASASASTQTAASAESHTYPPQAAADEEDPSSECLLCLSSPREVMLIPCRHLVACKECALNMVEFGAGGNITHAPEPVTLASAAEGNETSGSPAAEGGAATAAAGTSLAAIPPVATTRRKRKAKGWFCPVCRQPYTSLLRITTAAPPPPGKEAETTERDEDQSRRVPGANNAAGDAAAGAGDNRTDETGEVRSVGLLGGAFTRPGFLRNISLNRTASGQPPTSVPPAADIESQAGMGRVGA
ncbi:hypothetical protein P691DRAFT_775912 [Macrolepiota fuliginosa MF-IS2]|uniref:RING-type domain-containing protein n=1 Tax=Macrolepiota fuliginosa MF-IS2 TaxID=1400762 RepID=A0A9P5XAC1_9AGAR|nr:hypothetical protein P691DRAFT_775912 [Macrolepiota fuliginosa MF-IS2]